MIDALSAWLKTCLTRSPRRGSVHSRVHAAELQHRAASSRAGGGRSRVGVARLGGSPLSVESLEDRSLFAAGDLDPTFGENGVVSLSGYDWTDQAFQADGKVISVGTAAGSNSLDFVVARFNLNGTLDASFGGTGVVTLDLAGNSADVANAVAIDAQGRIIVAGESGAESEADFAVMRLNADGTLDATFGTNGIAVIDVGGDRDELNAVEVSKEGKILLAGAAWLPGEKLSDMAAVRLNPDGALDASFSDDGRTVVSFGAGKGVRKAVANALAIDSDGSVVLVGSADSRRWGASRLNADGTLDLRFSGDGKLELSDLSNTSQPASAVAFDSTGRIVVSGYDFTHDLLRLNADGSLDKNFDGDGYIRFDSVASVPIRKLTVDSQDRIVAVASDMVVYRVKVNGELDLSFSGDGKTDLNFGLPRESVLAVAANSDGTISVAGASLALSASGGRGTGPSQVLYARLTDIGSLDASGGGFLVSSEVGLSGLTVAGAVTLPEGKIIVGGSYQGGFALRRYDVDGSLDVTFGVDGIATLDVNGGANEEAKKVLLAADGKIVVVGESASRVAIARFNADGSVDLSFGVNGSVFVGGANTSIDLGNAAIDALGRIVIFGDSSGATFSDRLFAVRLTTSGQIDSTFNASELGNLGVGEYHHAVDLAIDAAGRIVLVAGVQIDGPTTEIDFVVVRLNSNGSLDRSFSSDGVQRHSIAAGYFDVAKGVAVDATGRIIVFGGASLTDDGNPRNVIFGLRLLDDGTPDDSFGGAGLATFSSHSGVAEVRAMKVADDDSLFFAGVASGDFFVMHITEDGLLDPAFADDGNWTLPFAGTTDVVTSIDFDAAGRLVVAGYGRGGGTVARLMGAATNLNLSQSVILEGASAGTAVGTVTVPGASLEEYGFTLLDDANGQFVLIDGVLRTTELFHASAGTDVVVRVLATAVDGRASEKSFKIVVASAPHQAELLPEPSDLDASVNSVAEGAAGGALVGITAHIQSDEAKVVDYSLSDDAGGRFTIDSRTGVVSVASAATINYETASSHLIRVVASIDGVVVARTEFTIEVGNLAPGPVVDLDYDASIFPENYSRLSSTEVTARATDPGGGPLTYSLLDDFGGRLRIDAQLGGVGFTSIPFNYESTPTVTFTVIATDAGGLSSSADFTITVTNLPPSRPIGGDPTCDVEYTGRVAEGSAAGTVVTGLDIFSEDPAGGTVYYSLTDDAGGRFEINSLTGEITVTEIGATSISYESASGYRVVVQASDGLLNSLTETFFIGVLNVPPSAPIDVNDSPNQVTRTQGDTSVGITFAATDPNGSTITYEIVSGTNYFRVSGNQVYVVQSNLPRSGSEASYTITVQAIDARFGRSTTTDFTIQLVDSPPTTPFDANGSLNRIAHQPFGNAGTGLRVLATDPDGKSITYRILNDPEGRFRIDSSGNVLPSNTKAIVYSDVSYTLVVQASDGIKTSQAEFTVDVLAPTVATAWVGRDELHNGATSLFLYGSSGNDSFSVEPGKKGAPPGTVIVTVNKVKSTFVLPVDGWINAMTGDGNDSVKLSSKLTNNAYLEGGDGNDVLVGGLGDDVIVGGAGNDSLNGQGGRDLVIGGLGKDKVYGVGTGSSSVREGNLLIGDVTTFDDDREALAAIAAAWSANAPATVEATIRSFFNDDSIVEDGQADSLKGTTKGIDWFWSSELTSKGKLLDKLSSLSKNDRLN